MNEPQAKANPDQKQGRASAEKQPQGAPKQAAQNVTPAKAVHTTSSRGHPQKPTKEPAQNNRAPSGKLKAIASSPATTNWLLVIIGATAGAGGFYIGLGQNALVKESNRIADLATKAAESAADSNKQTGQVDRRWRENR